MSVKKWVVHDADKDRASQISEKFNIDPFVAFLMVSRGIVKDIDVANFVADQFISPSPLNFADMDEAVFAIGEAIDIGCKICVYGDYDCDGVTATALLVDFLRAEGADVCYYIPSRENEGYGLNQAAIDVIKSRGVGLIVTVDNGIASFEEAEYVYSLGMMLVVTDHHQLSDGRLPRAEAVVNPHREDNDLDFHDYCGVGVAFKLACAMYEGELQDLVDRYIDLVAIGTIADVMPLIDENRSFVRAGVDKINQNPRCAIKAFIASGGGRKYASGDIAFQICPRINAMGRMGDAARAVEFLLSENEEEAILACNTLNEENANRQKTEQGILKDIEEKIYKNPKLVASPVIVISGTGYHHGVIGIVSAHLMEKYGKPAFVIGVDDEGIARGSARSLEGFNIYEAISACSEDLIKFGGHPLAAGITLSPDMIDQFRQDINEYALRNHPVMPASELLLDCKLSPAYLNLDLVNSLSILEPYGAGNPQVIFGIYKLTLLEVAPLSDGKHIKMELEKKGCHIRVVKFGTPYDEFPYTRGDVLNLAVKVSKNFYNNRTYLSIQAVDIRLSTFDEDKYFSEKACYDLYRSLGRADKSLYPNRSECVAVYKYLKAHNGYPYSLDDLYFRLQDKLTYGQLMFSLKAFSQAGLIKIGKTIELVNSDKKVVLEDTPVLKSLKGRLGIE